MAYSGQHFVGIIKVLEEDSHLGLIGRPRLSELSLNALHIFTGDDYQSNHRIQFITRGARKNQSVLPLHTHCDKLKIDCFLTRLKRLRMSKVGLSRGQFGLPRFWRQVLRYLAEP